MRCVKSFDYDVTAHPPGWWKNHGWWWVTDIELEMQGKYKKVDTENTHKNYKAMGLIISVG